MIHKTLIAVFAVLCLASAALGAADGTLGVYNDAVGSSCCLQIPTGMQGTLHVVVTLAGASGGGSPPLPAGITGAEFRLQFTNQNGYFLNWMPNPLANVTLGNPLDTTPGDPNDNHGITMAFSSCQGMMVGDKVSLGTITAFNAAGMPTEIRVMRKQPPSNPTLRDCPLLVLCDAPMFTTVCIGPMAAGEPEEPIEFATQLNVAGCNTTPGMVGYCGPVAVAANTWSGVKSLFR